MSTLRVVHYLNQFFAGVGAEEKANTPPASKDGPVGPGLALKAALGDAGEVVGTVFCGDNLAAERPGEVVPQIVALIAKFKPDVVVAGPAFAAGRYGLNCGRVCADAKEALGVPVVSGMHEENPGVDSYQTQVHIVSTRDSAVGMNEAIKHMAGLAVRLGRDEPVGSPSDEGYFPMGRRVFKISDRPAAPRAIEMLLKKVKGEPFVTEWPLPKYHRVVPAQAIQGLAKKKLALMTTGSLVSKGNPDRLERAWASKWLKYDIHDHSELSSDSWESIHGGFDTTAVNADPNRVVPLDAIRELEKEGVFGQLHQEIFSTTGNGATGAMMHQFGQEMVKELKQAGVDGVVLTAT